MKGSILIFGGTKTKRNGLIEKRIENLTQKAEKHPDVLILENARGKKSIGIDKVRKAIKFLNQKPYMSDQKFVIVKNAHYLTRQAQNALLKTLEEPPSYATIILEIANKDILLDTIISRCQQIKIKPETKKIGKEPQALSKIKNLSNGQKLELAEKFSKKERTEVILILETWVNSERNGLKTVEKTKKSLENLKILERVRKDLNTTNINMQLALEFLLLKIS